MYKFNWFHEHIYTLQIIKIKINQNIPNCVLCALLDTCKCALCQKSPGSCVISGQMCHL